jgi:hypothetical protein
LGNIEALLALANRFQPPVLNPLFVGQAIVGVLGVVISTRADFKRHRVDIEETVAPVVAPMHVPNL